MNVVALKRPEADDIVTALRNVADEIERGEYDFKPTMAVLVCADEEATSTGGSYMLGIHGLGVRGQSQLMCMGVMQAALSDLAGG